MSSQSHPSFPIGTGACGARGIERLWRARRLSMASAGRLIGYEAVITRLGVFVSGFLLLFLPFKGSAQSSGSSSLYQLSLAAYAEASGGYRGGKPIRVLETEYLRCACSGCSGGDEIVPSRAGSSVTECVTNSSMKAAVRKMRSGFGVVVINPIRNVGDELVVDCAEYSAGARRGKVVLGVYGGYRVYWRFDCAAGQYVKVRVEHYPPFIL